MCDSGHIKDYTAQELQYRESVLFSKSPVCWYKCRPFTKSTNLFLDDRLSFYLRASKTDEKEAFKFAWERMDTILKSVGEGLQAIATLSAQTVGLTVTRISFAEALTDGVILEGDPCQHPKLAEQFEDEQRAAQDPVPSPTEEPKSVSASPGTVP